MAQKGGKPKDQHHDLINFLRWPRYTNKQNVRPFHPCVLQQIPGNLSGRTDGHMDGHAAKPSLLVGWTNGPMYRWKEGISGFGRTDGQPENIMHPAPKGGGIKIMLKSMLVDKDFLTWLPNGWQRCCQPIRRQIRKSLLTNMDFKIDNS